MNASYEINPALSNGDFLKFENAVKYKEPSENRRGSKSVAAIEVVFLFLYRIKYGALISTDSVLRCKLQKSQ